MKRLTLLLILSYLSPYGVAQEVPLYETITDNVPKIGITTEVYLGDRMLEQRTGDYRECIIPKRTFETTMSGVNWVARANQPICKRNADSKDYYSTYKMVEGSSNQHLAKVIENNKTYELHLGVMYSRGAYPKKLRFKNLTEKDIEINGRYFLYQPESFQQTIEYAGKSGNILKFVYS